MNDTLIHRGPNDQGLFVNKTVSLGHRRLSIVDLSKKGHQPMISPSKKAVLVYNGEIYNHRELREELIKKGHKFKGHSDTEVLLASYLEWGEKCLEKFNGMWAFCIYDQDKKILFLSRDRLGQKPLYYFFDGKNFIFSSELKGIIAHKIKLKINKEAIDLYLSLGFIPAPYSIYEDIYKLGAGENLFFDLDKRKITKKRYYSYPKYRPIKDKKILIEEFNQLIEDATKIRLVDEVPLGAFLSGGIDSSVIVYQLNKLLKGKRLSTTSIGMKGCGDAKYSQILTKKLNLNNSLFQFNEQEFKRIKSKIFFYFDEPFADYSMFPTFFLSEITSKKMTVALSGDGADELFGGYPHYINVSRIALLKKFPTILRKIALWLLPKTKKTFLAREGIRVSLLKPEEIFSSVWEGVYRPEIFKKITREKMLEMLKLSQGDLTEAMMLFDRYFKSQGDNFLCKVDRASMANSLEVRSPFLDYRFLEYSSKIPSKWKANIFSTKILMKQALKKTLPKEILNRKKEGFNSPLIENLLLSKDTSSEKFKEIIKSLYRQELLSEKWKDFYLNVVSDSDNPLYNKYKIRLFLFNDWLKYWDKRINS